MRQAERRRDGRDADGGFTSRRGGTKTRWERVPVLWEWQVQDGWVDEEAKEELGGVMVSPSWSAIPLGSVCLWSRCRVETSSGPMAVHMAARRVQDASLWNVSQTHTSSSGIRRPTHPRHALLLRVAVSRRSCLGEVTASSATLHTYTDD